MNSSTDTWRIYKALSYLEIATSVAVLLTTGIAAILLLRAWTGSRAGAPASTPLMAGMLVPLGESIEFGRAERTLLLALDARCGFCAESVPFYRAIAGRILATAGKNQIIALFPNPRIPAESFMDRYELAFEFRESIDFRGIRVDRTPTLIVVDRSGRVLHTWVGKLGSAREREVALALNLN